MCRSTLKQRALQPTIVMMTSPRAFEQPRLGPPSQSASVDVPSRFADRHKPFHIRPRHIVGPHPLPSRQFQALFDSLFKVLFIFPSWYLFAPSSTQLRKLIPSTDNPTSGSATFNSATSLSNPCLIPFSMSTSSAPIFSYRPERFKPAVSSDSSSKAETSRISFSLASLTLASTSFSTAF